MLIVHIIIALNVGGAELMLKRLVEGHSRIVVRKVVVSLTDIGPVGKQLRANGIEVHALGLKGILGLPLVMWRLRCLLGRLHPDIVQTWMYHSDLIGGVVAYSLGIKSVIWGVRSGDVSIGRSRITVWIRYICAKLSSFIPTRIVCAAERSRQDHEAIGYVASRMVVIPNGFDLERFHVSRLEVSRLRADLGLDEKALVIGFMGRLNRVKGLDFFVQAAGLIAPHSPNAYFLLVGRGLDSNNVEFVDLINQTNAQERFRFLGERSDVPTCLAAMDIFCLSSRAEGFPNALGEAMSMSVPCVVADVGDAANLVGKTGVVVPKENHEALAEGVLSLMKMTSDQRQIMGQASRKRILDEFTMERCVDRFDEIYQQVLAEASMGS